MNKQTQKNLLIAIGVIGAGVLIYSLLKPKKPNKINIDVKDDLKKYISKAETEKVLGKPVQWVPTQQESVDLTTQQPTKPLIFTNVYG
jgi:hypothetical protein